MRYVGSQVYILCGYKHSLRKLSSGFCVRRHVATMSTCLDCSTVAAITLSYCRTTNVAHTKNNSPAKTYFTYIHTRTPSLNNSLCHNYRVCPVPWFLLPILQFHSNLIVIRSDLRTIQDFWIMISRRKGKLSNHASLDNWHGLPPGKSQLMAYKKAG